MMNKVVYPGSFDPITFGHIDIIKRASKIFDYIVIGIAKDNNKTNFLFSETERKSLIKNSLSSIENIEVKIFDGLLTDFVKQENSNIIIRGLRVLSDFEYEFRMALMNRKLDDEITTMFMMPNEKYTHISSSLIKEVASLGGSVDDYVPSEILVELNKKLNENSK